MKPQPGDKVVFEPGPNCDSWWEHEKPGITGIIDGMVGSFPDHLRIIFNPSVFRSESVVSCSGGPGTIALDAKRLKPTGRSESVRCWKWDGLPRAGGGVDYTIEVPVWTWDGSR